MIKFSKPGYIIEDRFGGASSTVKACMFIYKYLRFISFDSYKHCADAGIPSPVEMFPGQLLNAQSYNFSNDVVLAALKVFISVIYSISAKRHIYQLSAPRRPLKHLDATFYTNFSCKNPLSASYKSFNARKCSLK